MKPARISSCLLALIAIAVLASSCGNLSSESAQPTAPTEPTEITESPAPAKTTPTTPAPVENPTNAATLPDQVANQVKAAIAQSANVAVEAIQITRAEPQTWPNGCLGLANADEFCTEALVEGWQVEATDGKTTWIYRTDASGSQVRPET